jgi:RNA methyltransferase, TrmH family
MKKEMQELLKDRKRMKEERLFIVDTEKTLGEAVEAGFEVKNFFFSEKGEEINKKYGKKFLGLAERVKGAYIDRFAEVKTHQGFIALVKAGDVLLKNRILSGPVVLLDGIQDPANLGAIIRSGAAFGFMNYYLINCAYPYGEKAIRASAGNVFHVKYREIDFDAVEKLKKTHKLFITDVSNGISVKEAAAQAKGDYAIILGNEGQGVSPEIAKLADITLNIPLASDKVESLNVAAAAAVIFYEFSKTYKN